MSREIKFRAWDTIESEVFKRPIMHNWDYLKTWEAKLWFQKGVYLMQFTGLLDKSGKDIYEGDIVKFWTSRNSKSKEGWKEEVIFSEDGRWLPFNDDQYIQDEQGDWFCTDDGKDGFEVIGNIYENPDLLTN